VYSKYQTGCNRNSVLAMKILVESAPTLPPPKPLTWLEVGRQLKTIYESVLKTPR
jgi:hypothetical protein